MIPFLCTGLLTRTGIVGIEEQAPLYLWEIQWQKGKSNVTTVAIRSVEREIKRWRYSGNMRKVDTLQNKHVDR